MIHVRRMVGGLLTVIAFVLGLLAATLWFVAFALLALSSPFTALLLGSTPKQRVHR